MQKSLHQLAQNNCNLSYIQTIQEAIHTVRSEVEYQAAFRCNGTQMMKR